MISGFNTDIEYGGTVYHVQTEDKGMDKRVIMSLVYDKGTILASKRESYNDLATENFDIKALTDRVARQHKLICAAVSSGRLNELQEMSSRDAGAAKVIAEVVKAGIPLPVSISPQLVQPTVAPVPAPPQASFQRTVPTTPIKIAMVEADPIPIAAPAFSTREEPIVEAMRIIEDPPILSAEAVEVVTGLSGQERPVNLKLGIELLGDTKFKGGDRRTVNIMICRGTARRVVGDAQIMIKVLGSTFRPVIFHAKSDANGLAKVHLQLPHFQAGRAALLIRAMSDGEETELRRLVTPG